MTQVACLIAGQHPDDDVMAARKGPAVGPTKIARSRNVSRLHAEGRAMEMASQKEYKGGPLAVAVTTVPCSSCAPAVSRFLRDSGANQKVLIYGACSGLRDHALREQAAGWEGVSIYHLPTMAAGLLGRQPRPRLHMERHGDGRRTTANVGLLAGVIAGEGENDIVKFNCEVKAAFELQRLRAQGIGVMAVPRAFFGPSAPGGDGAAALGGSFFVRGPSSSGGGGADDDAEESPLLVHVSKGGLLQKQKWTSRSAPTATRPLGRGWVVVPRKKAAKARGSAVVSEEIITSNKFAALASESARHALASFSSAAKGQVDAARRAAAHCGAIEPPETEEVGASASGSGGGGKRKAQKKRKRTQSAKAGQAYTMGKEKDGIVRTVKASLKEGDTFLGGATQRESLHERFRAARMDARLESWGLQQVAWSAMTLAFEEALRLGGDALGIEQLMQSAEEHLSTAIDTALMEAVRCHINPLWLLPFFTGAGAAASLAADGDGLIPSPKLKKRMSKAVTSTHRPLFRALRPGADTAASTFEDGICDVVGAIGGDADRAREAAVTFANTVLSGEGVNKDTYQKAASAFERSLGGTKGLIKMKVDDPHQVHVLAGWRPREEGDLGVDCVLDLRSAATDGAVHARDVPFAVTEAGDMERMCQAVGEVSMMAKRYVDVEELVQSKSCLRALLTLERRCRASDSDLRAAAIEYADSMRDLIVRWSVTTWSAGARDAVDIPPEQPWGQRAASRQRWTDAERTQNFRASVDMRLAEYNRPEKTYPAVLAEVCLRARLRDIPANGWADFKELVCAREKAVAQWRSEVNLSAVKTREGSRHAPLLGYYEFQCGIGGYQPVHSEDRKSGHGHTMLVNNSGSKRKVVITALSWSGYGNSGGTHTIELGSRGARLVMRPWSTCIVANILLKPRAPAAKKQGDVRIALRHGSLPRPEAAADAPGAISAVQVGAPKAPPIAPVSYEARGSHSPTNGRPKGNRHRKLLPHQLFKVTRVGDRPQALQEMPPSAFIDPGVDVFLTCYVVRPEGVYVVEFGKGFSGYLRRKYDRALRKLQGEVARDEEGSAAEAQARRDLLLSQREREVARLHESAAARLLALAECVFLPKLDTAVLGRRRRSGGLSASVKDRMFSLGHARFRDLLERRAANAGALVDLRTIEWGSSKACGECGSRNGGLGGSRTFRCPRPGCGHVERRDPGSARKIALMCLHMHAKRSAGAENGRNNEGVRAGVADAQDLGGGTPQ